MKKIIYILAVAFCLGSCVYPFDDFADNEVGNLVVEGDIVVGGISYFLPTRLLSLNSVTSYEMVPSTIWVEADDGKTYPGQYQDQTYGYSVDLKSADAAKAYRLRLDTDDGKHYASTWGKAEGKVNLQNVSYQTDTISGKLSLMLNLESDGSSRHFRYRYTEDWEYHAYTTAFLYYDTKQDTVFNFQGTDNTYFCWRKSISRGLNLATTEKMSEDKLKDYTFMTIPRSDERLSVLYRIKLDVYPVSPLSYAYYENVRDVSAPTGDLFSPIPSEVRGNIRNTEDEAEMVYGYVAVVQPSSATVYYDNEKAQFYRNTQRVEYEEVAVTPDQFRKFYYKGYLPVRSDPFEGIMWGQARCLDCRLLGGTKNKPDNWPNDAK